MKYKQCIVVRKDLQMSSGKFGVQCAHASEESTALTDSETLLQWRLEGFRKVVLSADSVADILKLEAKCIELKIPHFTVYDFGLTELEPNTLTCIGIGPGKNEDIDKVTKRIKLWK